MGLFDKIFGGSKTSNNPSSVWAEQSPFLLGLYQRAQNASLGLGTGGGYAPTQSGGYSPYSGGGSVRSQGRQNWAQQQGGRANTQPAPGQPGQQGPVGGGDPLSALGWNLTNQGLGYQGGLMESGMGGGPFGSVLQDYSRTGNPYAMAQVQQLQQGLGRLFQQGIAPAINSQFAGAGQLGGARQALALGQAGEGLGQAFTSGAYDILGNSAQLGVQAAGLGANMQLGANQAGLQGLGSVFGLGNAGMYGSLPGLQSLLGGPTVLGGGGSTYQTGGILGALSGGITKSGNWGIGVG